MNIQEIYTLKQQSPALRETLKTHKEAIYRFLRQDVQARFGYYPQGAHTCEKCGKTVYPTLKSPYNAFNPGWCIDCVLEGFFNPETPIYNEYFDPKSPNYDDLIYAHNKEIWDHFYDLPEDYDGPPIVIA